ncbi:MAG: hypothetical protein H3C43_11245, partial [Leptonema sp. (in: Bacteria)]|nr:hypothetical protein [Leptonema sp. (in: bacteria)]
MKIIDLSTIKLLDDVTAAHITQLHQTLTGHGFRCHLVGGCVRDMLLGLTVQDIDITTDAHPNQVIQIFKRTVPTGIKHGTVTVLLDNRSYEVTTYRTESEYSDARRPDQIQFANTLEEDLSRRDFTINALALDPITGELTDLFDGEADLQRKLIRTIGRPEDRFFEDGLRPVRACRFRSSLGFEIETNTFQAMLTDDVRNRIRSVAIERFSDELWKGMKANQASPMLISLQEANLLTIFVPSSRPVSVFDLQSIDNYSDPVFRMWRFITYSSNQPEQMAKSLRFSAKIVRIIGLYTALLQWLKSFNENHSLQQQQIECRPLLAAFKKGVGVEPAISLLNNAKSFILKT